jgi:hypothetical protein
MKDTTYLIAQMIPLGSTDSQLRKYQSEKGIGPNEANFVLFSILPLYATMQFEYVNIPYYLVPFLLTVYHWPHYPVPI